MQINIGCGSMILEDYINCDLYNDKADVKCDAKLLPFEDDSVDKIIAIHLIEHFDFKEAFIVLKEWYRVLKKDGILWIETPDFLESCRKFVFSNEQERINMYSHFFSEPWIPGQIHKFLYTETQLRWTLENCGFKNILRKEAKRYINLENITLGMEAMK
jgi:predicted SAM-dependent methyltransferase